MKTDYQKILFDLIKSRLKGDESLGNVLGEVLFLSHDAVYRRYRGETALTIDELEKLCRHFSISLDGLFEIDNRKVMFDVPSLEDFDFSMISYLENIRNGLTLIKSNGEPSLSITVNNTPLLQLLNYPHLVRFKLFFWAKTHLQIEDYKTKRFEYEKITENAFNVGREILQLYNSIPSKELYDPEFLRGFIREIYYYYKAHLFEDSQYAINLLNTLDEFTTHLENQAACGKKYIATTQPPASGCEFEMYYNETLNGVTSIHYQTQKSEGIYIAHNFMNFLHTSDEQYVKDSAMVMQKQFMNSSKISEVNEKERNAYFAQIRSEVNKFRQRIELDLTF